MITQHHDRPSVKHSSDTIFLQYENQRYYAEVSAHSLDEQSRLIEQVMSFAFETLGVRHLDVRVVGADQNPM
jgi:hypothetical protein